MENRLGALARRSGIIATRSVLAKRGVSHGAIAGIVIGVVVGVALLLLCLYPLVIRRRRARADAAGAPPISGDVETAEVPNTGSATSSSDARQRRSSDDFIKNTREVARGAFEPDTSKDLGWNAQAQPGALHLDTNIVPGGPTTIADGLEMEGITETNDIANYDGSYVSHIWSADQQNPQGSNADYYSPDVPSSAFGMYDEPQSRQDSKKTSSRASSLRENLKRMLSRKNTRDQSLQSTTSPTIGEAAKDGRHQPVQRITTNDVTSESPTELSPPEAAMLPSPTPRALGSPVNLQPSVPQGAVQTPPQSPPTEAAFVKTSPSPPTNPAPGTVNPMDIMPATTDTEMFHRTEHQLYMSYNQSSPNPESPPEQPNEEPLALPHDEEQHDAPTDSPSPFTLPPNLPLMTPIVEAPTPMPQSQETTFEMPLKEEHAESHDIAMMDIPSQNYNLSPMPSQGHTRYPSYPSDASTPLPGPASTTASTLNTPQTQLDTPSPHSRSSSDYRHSASPSNIGENLSPKTGTYPCDEPGCNQVFDQPHKLKHHQRYHTKEHKCPYQGCGKGFGTKTHLQRHINDRHEKKKKFHCAVPGCDYSRQGGKGFPRKDNWKRHMTKIHNMDQRQLPEPVEADQEMGGM